MPWRGNIRRHPALDLLDPPSPAAIEALARRLAEDASGAKVTIWKQRKSAEPFVVGGLDVIAALERNGGKVRAEASSLDGETAVSMWCEVWRCGGRDAIPITIEEYRGDLGSDPHLLVLSDHARSITSAQRRDAVARVLRACPRLTDQRLASAAKLTPAAVAAIRAKLTAPPKPPVETRQEPALDAKRVAETLRKFVKLNQRPKLATALRQIGAADIADALVPAPTAARGRVLNGDEANKLLSKSDRSQRR